MSVMTQEALLGKLIPSVYIDGVTLESSGDPPLQDDPHIDTGSAHGIVENKFLSSVGSENTLRCVVDVSMKEVLDDDLIGRWFDDEKVSKYIKLMVVQSTDPVATRALSNNTQAISLVHPHTAWDIEQGSIKLLSKGWKSTDISFLKAKMNTVIKKRFLDINHDVVGDRSDLTQKRSFFDQDGNSVVDINFRATFVIPQENPKHVSYFAVAFLDMAGLMEDYDIRANEYTLRFQNGKVASEIAIDDWKTMGTAIAFFDRDGQQFIGPVHERGSEGSWATGTTETAESVPLSLRKVPNSKIHDFRNVKEIKKLRIDLSTVDQELRPLMNKLGATNSDNKIRAKKNVYFSDVYLARDRWGRAKLAFALDYYKLVKESSKYNRVYEQASKTQRNAMLNSSRVKSMKFVRRRVKNVLTKNALGNPVSSEVLFDREEPRVVLAYTGENKNGTLQAKSDRFLGGLREIRPALDDPQQGIRFFTAEDRSMYHVTDGIYQYGVEITVEDGTQKFLEGILKNLISHKKMLASYLNKASQLGMTKYVVEMSDPHIDTSWERARLIKSSGGNYEPSSNRFTKKFIEEQRAIWRGKEQYSPWSKPLFVYLNALELLTNINAEVGTKKAIQELMRMTRPESGNPKGIMTLIDLMSSLIVSISSLIGVNSSNKNNPSRASAKTSKLPTKTHTLEYWFSNENHDSNVVKNRGYDYLSLNSGAKRWENILANFANPGLRIVSGEKYRKRVEFEITRYYDQISTDLNMKIGTNVVTSGDRMENTSWGFMSPSICYLAENNVSSFVKSSAGTTQDVYNDDYYSSIAGNILYANASSAPVFPTPVNAEDSALGSDAQKFRSSMGAFFSGMNLSLFDADSSDVLAITDVPFLSSLFRQPLCDDIKDSDGNVVNSLPDDSSLDPISDPNTVKNYNNIVDATNLNPNTFYLSMMNSFLRSGFSNNDSTSSPFGTKSNTVKIGASEVSTNTVSIWDLGNTSNVVNWMAQSSEYMRTVALSCGQSYTNSTTVSDVLKMFPIQFKGLMLSSVNSGNVRRNLHNLGYEARYSVQTNSYYEFNYNLINRIDYLAGYQRTEGMRVKNPIWKPLSFAKWDSSTGEYLLCRQKSFECQSLGITKPDGLALPVYDSYFILIPKTNVKPPSGANPGLTDAFDQWGDYVTSVDNAVASDTTTNEVGTSLTFCPPHGNRMRAL